MDVAGISEIETTKLHTIEDQRSVALLLFYHVCFLTKSVIKPLINIQDSTTDILHLVLSIFSNVLNNKDSLRCESCFYKGESSAFCRDCAQLIDKKCRKYHKEIRHLRSHDVREFQGVQPGSLDIASFIPKFFCKNESHQKSKFNKAELKYFCVICELPLCESGLTEHRGSHHVINRLENMNDIWDIVSILHKMCNTNIQEKLTEVIRAMMTDQDVHVKLKQLYNGIPVDIIYQRHETVDRTHPSMEYAFGGAGQPPGDDTNVKNQEQQGETDGHKHRHFAIGPGSVSGGNESSTLNTYSEDKPITHPSNDDMDVKNPEQELAAFHEDAQNHCDSVVDIHQSS